MVTAFFAAVFSVGMQYYTYGEKHSTRLAEVKADISTVQRELKGLSEKVITKDHLIQFGEELGKHNPYYRNVNSTLRSIFKRHAE